MITRSNQGFFAAHYDWIAAVVGAITLAGGGLFYFLSLGENADEAAAVQVSECFRKKASAAGVKPVDMVGLDAVAKSLKTPPTATDVSIREESFLASERRVLCRKCGKAIVGDVKACPACPACGEAQERPVKVVLDADGDGLPDEWEKRYGLKPNDAADANEDKDRDGFTNKEEFAAKTDPSDAKDHPDYLDSLKVVLPLKETKLPFVFRKASQIPGGWRCDFLDPSRKDDYGRAGRTISVKTGDKIIDATVKEKFDYGYTLKSYTAKSVKRERKGMKGMMVEVDVSEVVVERNRDGKKITLVIQHGKNAKLASVDVQATLSFERGTTKTYDVTAGDTLELYGNKYKVMSVEAVGKGAKVTLENVVNAKRRTLEALAQ